ncbi:hypothetical protein PUMCH_000690 [Australozyma saopauloensis]|uniref:Uncharacterized protein n=1 Tax=Australozyma saopauloensis TaxID=291208 RepID=A0AAX4H4L5_9ASCO|nr:hypothetical protein PUMCH_000690 [[Candida] saopauloensis]
MSSLQLIQDSKNLILVAVPLMDSPLQIAQSAPVFIQKRRKQKRRRGGQKADNSSASPLAVQPNTLTTPGNVQPPPSAKKRRGRKKGTKHRHNSSTGNQVEQPTSSSEREYARSWGGKHPNSNSTGQEEAQTTLLTTPLLKKRKGKKGKKGKEHRCNSPAVQQNVQPSPPTLEHAAQPCQLTALQVARVPHVTFDSHEASFVESNCATTDPDMESRQASSLLISEDERLSLERIVEQSLNSLCTKRRWPNHLMDFSPLVDVLVKKNGTLFLSSITTAQFASKMRSLCSHLKSTELKTEGLPLPEFHRKEALTLIKQLIMRPGRVPTDADASILLDELKTREGQLFLKAFLKAFNQPAKKDALDIIVVACEFLSASLYEVENYFDRRHEAREFVRYSVSFKGGCLLGRLLLFFLEIRYKKFIDPFLLGKKDEARVTFKVIAYDEKYNPDLLEFLFDTLWSRVGLSFMLLAAHRNSVPKAWEATFALEGCSPFTTSKRFSRWWHSYFPTSKMFRFL